MWKFRKKIDIPTAPVEYPSGTCILTEKGYFFVHRDGTRIRIPNRTILDSWNFPFVAKSSELAASNYKIAFSKMTYRDGTLLNNFADGKLYLVSDGALRHITNPAVMTRLGLAKNDAVVLSDTEIKALKVGKSLD